jgi:hypothetical protein
VHNLSPISKTLLAALYENGAQRGQPYTTNLSTLARQAGIAEDGSPMLVEALRELVRSGISIGVEGKTWTGSLLSTVDVAGDGRVTLIVSLPMEILRAANLVE